MSGSIYHGVYDPYALGFKAASSGSFEVGMPRARGRRRGGPWRATRSIMKALQRSWLFLSCWRAERWQH